jgi:leucyl-tRNA synthetase
MFPYPSGNGLHIGHAYNYAVVDSYCRWKRNKGVEVFQPFGYDSFGLPAEMYAEKVGRDPRDVTYENIENFRGQMSHMNTQYEEKLITSDSSYYKWTQWLFTKLYESGLAYKKMSPVNWDPVLKTVLANEQVKDGISERSGAKVEQKELNQWFFKITDYKDRLIKNLDELDYPESTKKQQRHWLENLQDWCVSRQRKWGCPIPIEGEEDTLDTFVDSSFYYLRYLTDSDEEFLPKEKYKQVDLYVGGSEHACMHLIYARFINMFLYDQGYVECEEPFKKLIHQGMITKDGSKMSKSTGNVVNPDDYDPDELRMYLMFIGHYFDGGDWDDGKIVGIRRTLGKWRRWVDGASDDGEGVDVEKLEEDVNGYVEAFKFNKVISTMSEFYNKNKGKTINKDVADRFEQMITCFAPGFKK